LGVEPDPTFGQHVEPPPDASELWLQRHRKPRVPETKSLAQLIDDDISDFHQAYPGMAVTVESPVPTADHKQLKLVTFAPSAGGNWERVAYGEDAEFYLVFTVSSRTKGGLERAMPAFKAMVASHRVAVRRICSAFKQICSALRPFFSALKAFRSAPCPC